ncbi:MAG: hypothetical protein WC423_17935, partial [Vulcanimicrobiota bacterium]
PEAKFSSNRSTIPQKIPLQEEKNVLRLARNAKCPQALVHKLLKTLIQVGKKLEIPGSIQLFTVEV